MASLLLAAVVILPILTSAQLMLTSTKLRPLPEIYNGTNTATTNKGVVCAIFTNSELICSGLYILNDGDVGPAQGYNISKVFAWSRDFDVVFSLPAPTIVTRVSLFFYNQPSVGIGLPNVDGLFWDTASSLFQTNALSFTIAGNQDLSQSDTGLRNVSFVITSNATVIPYMYLRIRFSFPSSIMVTTTPLIGGLTVVTTPLPSTVSPPIGRSISLLPRPNVVTLEVLSPLTSYNLSCTVVNEGSFDWNWTIPVSVQYQMWIGDGTRTSILQLQNISSTYSGSYVCVVRYRSTNTMANTTITMQFPTVAVVSPNMASRALFDYVTFTCEVYGYSSPSSMFSWSVPGNNLPITMDILTYQLMNTYGNNSLQSGGSTLGKSRISSLYLRIFSEKDYGSYTCAYGLSSATATLLPPPPPVMTTTKFSTIAIIPSMAAFSASSEFKTGPVIGGVVGCIGLLIAVTAGLIVGVVCLKRHYSIRVPSQKDTASCEPVYSDVSKPEPPPYPAHFFNSINTYASVDSGKLHQGSTHVELKMINGSPDPPPTNGTLQKLTVGFGYLRPNPMYTSADNLLSPNGQGAENGCQSFDATDGVADSVLDIYAKPLPPNARCISVASNSPPPLPQPYNPIYSEALSPIMFMGPSGNPETVASASSEEFLGPCVSIYADPEPLTRSEGPLTVGPQNIREVKPLGVGQFGHVILAETVNLSLKDLRMSDTNNDKGVCVLVAVKRLKEDADRTTMEAFEKEIKFMSRLNHENVVRVLGVCPARSAFIMMEYMENGDLSLYLQRYEFGSRGGRTAQPTLSASSLVHMALHVAAGMRYLSSRHFIHRDLATRNCLVGAKNVVKIADFGMSRSLYSNDYYKLRGRAMLPIRWMAKECFYGIFSQKTDVWAYGVTMWQIFTFSKLQPYDDMTDQQVIENAITDSGRVILAKPSCCPAEVYGVMLRCWDSDPETRATFEELYQSLTETYASMCNDIP